MSGFFFASIALYATAALPNAVQINMARIEALMARQRQTARVDCPKIETAVCKPAGKNGIISCSLLEKGASAEGIAKLRLVHGNWIWVSGPVCPVTPL